MTFREIVIKTVLSGCKLKLIFVTNSAFWIKPQGYIYQYVYHHNLILEYFELRGQLDFVAFKGINYFYFNFILNNTFLKT
jgi:hypothetical protein